MKSFVGLLICILTLAGGAGLVGCSRRTLPAEGKISWRYNSAQLSQAIAAAKGRPEYLKVEWLFRRATALCEGAAASGECAGILFEGTRSVGVQDEVHNISFGILRGDGTVVATFEDKTSLSEAYSFAVLSEMNAQIGVGT